MYCVCFIFFLVRLGGLMQTTLYLLSSQADRRDVVNKIVRGTSTRVGNGLDSILDYRCSKTTCIAFKLV